MLLYKGTIAVALVLSLLGFAGAGYVAGNQGLDLPASPRSILRLRESSCGDRGVSLCKSLSALLSLLAHSARCADTCTGSQRRLR